MNYIVYRTVNLINGKIYVGVHRTDPDVFDGYIGCGVKGQVRKGRNGFRAAVRKYGHENFRRETLFVFPDTKEGEAQAYAKEAEIVDLAFVKRRDTYNIALGGKRGPRERTGKPVAQYGIDGTFIRTWDSVTEACNALGLTAIGNCVMGRTAYCGGFQWRRFNGDVSCIPPVKVREKTVYQFDLQGNMLKVWKSITEAAASLGDVPSARSAICNVCNRKAHQAYGYYWSFRCRFEPMAGNHLAAVARYDDDGRFIESYTSVAEAARRRGIRTPESIVAAIKGSQKRCGGCRWRYFYGNTSDIRPLTR